MSSPTKTFFPNLDGLRFFAFFAVFIHHSIICLGYENSNFFYKLLRKFFLLNGDLGVSFFFVLSGFLITYLLLAEKEEHGRVNIKNFYIRRILRIWPLYFFIVFLGLAAFPLFAAYLPAGFPIGVGTAKLNPWLYLTFTGNFDYILNGISNVLIGILWSVSIEEQFYLFWPLLIAFIPRKYLLPAFICVIMGAVAFRFFCSGGGKRMIINFHTLSCMSDLASGAVTAYLATIPKFIRIIRQLPKFLIILIYVIGFVIFPFREYVYKLGNCYLYAAAILPVVISFFFAFIIAEQNYAEQSFYKVGKCRPVSSLGKLTYGMYCYHMMVLFITLLAFNAIIPVTTGMNKYIFLLVISTAFITIVCLSKFSYLYFESVFLKLKKHYS